MNIVSNIIGVLSFDNTDNRVSKILRQLYFALGYNTTFPVNVMLTLGVLSPYVLFQANRHDLSVVEFSAAVVITLLSTYCYNLIYIVNDYIDHDKDILLRTPKQSALQVLGQHYLFIVLSCFAAIIGAASLLWPSLLMPLVGYSLALAGLSSLHSKFQNIKLLTIFIERFTKFCAPLWLILIVTGSDDARMMFAGALLIYPFGYTMDYAYRGYIRDRLKLHQSIRFIIYAIYGITVAGLFALDNSQNGIPLALSPLASFIGIYTAASLLSAVIAARLPFNFLDSNYSPHVAWEKRRLLAYGLVQTTLLVIGGIYAIYR